MEVSEVKVNLKEIETDFLKGLQNAESQAQADKGPVSSIGIDKSRLNLPNVAIKLVCDIKNAIAAKVITKDMDEESKNFVRDYLKTSPKEIDLYKRILEDVGTDFTPEEYKAFLNKWLCSPIVLLIEHEVERLLALKEALKHMKVERKIA